MKWLQRSIYFIFLQCTLISTHAQKALDSVRIYPLQSIHYNAQTQDDLKFLKDLLKDNQILLLGEQSHGDGATFDAKVRLIQYLHEELNYDILCFENGLYDNYKAFEEINKENIQQSPLHQSGFSMWFDTEQLRPLIEYIHQQKETKHPLQIAGFDCQEAEYFENNFYNELITILLKSNQLSMNDKNTLQMAFENGLDYFTQSSTDSAKFYTIYPKLISTLEETNHKSPTIVTVMLLQSLISWESGIQFALDNHYDRPMIIQNPRDEQMAQNLLFLARLYPNKKIIAWGASYHFAKNLTSVNQTALTDSLLHQLAVASHDQQDSITINYTNAIPMGKILADSLGSKIYSLSFSSFDGEFGMLGDKPIALSNLTPPLGSLEHELTQKNFQYAWCDFQNKTNAPRFYLSALGNIPLLGHWQESFDGNLFIQHAYPPSFIQQNELGPNQPRDTIQVKPNKYVVDASSKKPIEFAQIQKLHSTTGVLSNAQGAFAFEITNANSLDSIRISSIGFHSSTLSYEVFKNQSIIELQPSKFWLRNINVKAKELTAKEIIQKAAHHIEQNYVQQAFEQDLFYRAKSMIEDSLEASDLAQVRITNLKGIQNGKLTSTHNTIIKRNIYPVSTHSDIAQRLTSNDKYFSYSILTTTRNPLKKTDYYQYDLIGITTINDKKVYQINFVCTKLSRKATGLGNIPSASKGTFYIEVENFAILKFEQITHCSPKTFISQNDSITHSHYHIFIQTFQEYKGKYYLAYSKNSQTGQVENLNTHKLQRNYRVTEFMSKQIQLLENKTLPSVNENSPIAEFIFQDDDIHEIYKQLNTLTR